MKIEKFKKEIIELLEDKLDDIRVFAETDDFPDAYYAGQEDLIKEIIELISKSGGEYYD